MCTRATVKAKADHPGTLPIINLVVPRLAFRRLWAHSGSFSVQIQVSGHAVPSSMLLDCGINRREICWNLPYRHTEKHPSPVLLISLNRTCTPQCEQEICLDDFQRFIPLGRDGKSQFFRYICKFVVKRWTSGIKPRRYGTNFK